MKIAWLSFALLFLYSLSMYAAKEITPQVPQVKIEKLGDRDEAVIPDFEKPRIKPSGWFNQTCYYIEGGILKTARLTSAAAGKVADTTVVNVQKTTHVIFSPIVKALDVKRWFGA